VADIGRSPSAVVCPAFQAGRKGARISLRTMRYLAPGLDSTRSFLHPLSLIAILMRRR
jgi:hypothetical protein